MRNQIPIAHVALVPGLLALCSALLAGCGDTSKTADSSSGMSDDNTTTDTRPSDTGTHDTGSEIVSTEDTGTSQTDSADTHAETATDTASDSSLSASPWYETEEPLELSVTGALGDAFAAAFAGQPDGFIPPLRVKDPFPGELTYPDAVNTVQNAAVTLAVRGFSSLQECSFPKLKFWFAARVEDPSDVFVGTKKVKLGTHCGEENDADGMIGRLRHERATWREELVYQLARAAGITTLHTRPAIATYTDTSTVPAFASPLVRKAFLLEHIDELARQLGAETLLDPETSCHPLALDALDATVVARIRLFHALVSNWDWSITVAEDGACTSFWNTEVLVYPDGQVLPVPADFDLAAMVTGLVHNPDNNQFETVTAQNAEAAARFRLQESFASSPPEVLANVKDEYLSQETLLRAVIDASRIDEEGKQSALLLLDGFYAALL